MKTVIMAGGRGTRISELFPDIPKPLIPIEGVPVLEREIISLRNQGFKDIIMTVSHMGDKIMNHFGDGSKLEVEIQYYNEITPLGNAGALFKLREQLGDEPFLLLNADAVFDVDFNRMVRFHQEHGGLVILITILMIVGSSLRKRICRFKLGWQRKMFARHIIKIELMRAYM